MLQALSETTQSQNIKAQEYNAYNNTHSQFKGAPVA